MKTNIPPETPNHVFFNIRENELPLVFPEDPSHLEDEQHAKLYVLLEKFIKATHALTGHTPVTLYKEIASELKNAREQHWNNEFEEPINFCPTIMVEKADWEQRIALIREKAAQKEAGESSSLGNRITGLEPPEPPVY